ncbi:MAG: hypothetical protein CM15mP70_18430 [Pelagibacteraceae bacterium]|nr:MAG: hypothetical protein CM15mP70_18430 [Pelagibacteraceae bacterium]
MRYVSIVPNKISPLSIFDLISDLLLYSHLNLLPEKNVFGLRPVFTSEFHHFLIHLSEYLHKFFDL